MDCWTILGIEPDSDKKTIKIAYAKQLKTTRPDEDVEAFQRLHQAYKTALIWVPAEHSGQADNDWMNSPQDALREAYERDIEPLSDTNSAVLEEEAAADPTENRAAAEVDAMLESALSDQPDREAEDPLTRLPYPAQVSNTFSPEEQQLLEDIRNQEHHLSEDWAVFCEKLEAVIASPKQSAVLQNWTFIEQLSSFRDLEFRKAISDKAFEAVAEANDQSLQKKHLYIKRPVLNYLNGLFGWDKKWQEYEYHYSRSQLNAVFPYLEEAERVNKRSKIKRELFYYRRGAAFAIDMVIMFIPLLFINPLAELAGWQDMIGEMLLWWFAAYVLLVIPLQESSMLQATVGKRVMGLIVIDRRGDRIGFIHALSRSIVTAFCVLVFKLVVFINLILAWWRSEILQDLLTRSYVVQKPKRR